MPYKTNILNTFTFHSNKQILGKSAEIIPDIEQLAINNKLHFAHYPNVHNKVVSCMDAVVARKIELESELKSILLKIEREFCIVHMRANKALSSKKIKPFFRDHLRYYKKGFRFASYEELRYFGIASGLVSPFHPRLDDLKQFVCKQIIESDTILYTNDGSYTGYVTFSPILLTLIDNVIIGDFSE